jgi:2'-5' RNA ligase
MDLVRAMLILSGHFDKWGTDKYSCVMANASEGVRSKIDAWSRYNIEESSLYRDPIDPTQISREWQSHITILYGLHTSNPLNVAEIIDAKQIAPFDVTLGNISLFSKPDCDVVKIDVTSPELVAFNAALRELPNSNEYPVYQPHLTIAYVKPGIGLIFKDAENFNGLVIKVDRVKFSAAAGRETILPLYGVQLV